MSNVVFPVLQSVQSSEDIKEVEKLRKVSLFRWLYFDGVILRVVSLQGKTFDILSPKILSLRKLLSISSDRSNEIGKLRE